MLLNVTWQVRGHFSDLNKTCGKTFCCQINSKVSVQLTEIMLMQIKTGICFKPVNVGVCD